MPIFEYLAIHEDHLRPAPNITKSGNRFSAVLMETGYFRLSSAKNVLLYSVEVLNNRGFLDFYDGNYRRIFGQPSSFTGSFVWQGHAENGLIVRNNPNGMLGSNVTVTWLEDDE